MDDSNDLFSAMDGEPRREQPKPAPARPAPARPAAAKASGEGYDASDIAVLEGLEPVRRRPGMYIGGTDEKAMHHLFAEVIDNSMDEAVAGHATWIEVELDKEGYLSVTDNGRGIPVDPHPHPKMQGKSTVEVMLTMLHAGGKFDSKAYETSGGLHGVGVSVVNALSIHLEVEVARNRQLYRQEFRAGHAAWPARADGRRPQPARHQGALQARRGDLRQGLFLRSGTAVQDGALQGLSFRRRRDPLEMRARTDARKGRDAAGRDVSFPRRPQGLSRSLDRQAAQGDGRAVRRHAPARAAAMARWNGPLPGMATTASSIPTATPFPPPRAARTKRAFASRSPAG